MKIWLSIALVFLAAVPSRAQIPPPKLTLPTVNDSALSDYLVRLADDINAHLNPSLGTNVIVLASDSINAYALPSGDVYVTRGLLKAIANEAEVVFVLAQQLTALQLSRATKHNLPTNYQRSKSNAGHSILVGLVSGALIALGGPIGIEVGIALIAQEIGHRGTPRYASWQTTSASFITDADRMALEYLHQAGYDPEAAITMLEKLRAARPKGYVRQGELPPPPITFRERIRLLRKRIARLEPKDEYLLDSSAFKTMKIRLGASALPMSTDKLQLRHQLLSSSSN